MARGRRSAPGRRSGVGADSGAGGADDDDEDTGRGDIDDPDTAGFDDVIEDDDPGPTSAEDLASEADPQEFDQTFTDDDAPLSIAGNFDPSAGSKQVIPRLAFVLNYNLIYNAERDRWEPQKKSRPEGGPGRVGVWDRSVVSPTPQATYTLAQSDTITVAFDGTYAYHNDFGDPNGTGSNDSFLAIYDLSDPGSPFRVSATVLGDFYEDLAVAGDYLYGVNAGSDLYVVDVSDRSNPSTVATLSSFFGATGVAAGPNEDYCYVADTRTNVVDVTTKTSPSVVGDVDLDNRDNGIPHTIAYHEDFVYVGMDSDNSPQDDVRVYDVTTKTLPRPVGMTSRTQPLAMALGHDVVYDETAGVTVMGSLGGTYYVTSVDLDTLADDAS